MSISDEELVRQLESVPMVDPPQMRDAVMSRIRGAAAFRPPAGGLKPAATRFITLSANPGGGSTRRNTAFNSDSRFIGTPSAALSARGADSF
jgi:hypothetical protein